MNGMEKELLSLEKGMEWLINQIETADKKNFNMNTPAGKQKYKLAQERLKDNWVNYERNGGTNPWLLAILRKRTGLPAAGGRGGLTIDFGKDAIPQGITPLTILGKNWAWGRNKLTVNKAGTHYASGHARGTPIPTQALLSLQKDQKWVYKALTEATLDRHALKNVPSVILNSDQADIKKIWGRWGFEDETGRTRLAFTGGNVLDRRGGLNPFASDKYIDANVEIQKGSVISKKRFLGRRNVNNPIFNRHGSYGSFKTNSIKDISSSGFSADGNDGTGTSISKTKEYNNLSSNRSSLGLYQFSENLTDHYGGGGWVGRRDNVLTSTGDITSLSINQLNRRFNGADPGESLGVMNRHQKKRYKDLFIQAGGKPTWS